jgi:hypothetical protein
VLKFPQELLSNFEHLTKKHLNKVMTDL